MRDWLTRAALNLLCAVFLGALAGAGPLLFAALNYWRT